MAEEIVVDRGDELKVDDKAPPKVEPKVEVKAEPAPKAGPEAKVEAEADPKAEPGKKDTRIPLSRHEQLLTKEREARQALEKQLANFQKGEQVTKTSDEIAKLETSLLTMEGDYNKLIGDGKVEAAAALMTKIRQAERSIIETKADLRLTASVAIATETARYNVALERVEEAYPELNSDGTEFDEEKHNDVADLMAVYRSRGDTPTAALQKAVKKVMGSPASKAQETATTVTPRVDADAVAAERKKAAAAATAKTVAAQPSSTEKAGLDHDKTGGKMSAAEVMKLSQDAFAKLPENELARLRGDEI